jgi:hypothetical protein
MDLDRIATVIEPLTGVRHHPAHVWALLRHRLGWSVQRPMRRAVDRDQAPIDRWVKEAWPRIKQTPINDGRARRTEWLVQQWRGPRCRMRAHNWTR